MNKRINIHVLLRRSRVLEQKKTVLVYSNLVNDSSIFCDYYLSKCNFQKALAILIYFNAKLSKHLYKKILKEKKEDIILV